MVGAAESQSHADGVDRSAAEQTVALTPVGSRQRADTRLAGNAPAFGVVGGARPATGQHLHERRRRRLRFEGLRAEPAHLFRPLTAAHHPSRHLPAARADPAGVTGAGRLATPFAPPAVTFPASHATTGGCSVVAGAKLGPSREKSAALRHSPYSPRLNDAQKLPRITL